MRFGAAFWLNRTTWPHVREAVSAAEDAGFDSVWMDDHLLVDEGAADDDRFEGWATLAALAPLTRRPTLGLLVGANTFRNPGLTAKLATTLDHLTGGRAVLGLGAGWFELEHEAFDLDFGRSVGERLERLEEAVGLIRSLLDGETVTAVGPHYRLRDAVARPRPLQTHLPILIGGQGRRTTLRIVARYADVWNAYGTPAELAEADAVLRRHCREVGRDQAAIERSATQTVVIRASRAQALTEFARVVADHGPQPGEDRLDLGGTPRDVAEGLAGYHAVGVRHVMWVFRDPFDLETMARLGDVRHHLAAILQG
jgi:F420-dependent oxidoreductase-like protein